MSKPDFRIPHALFTAGGTQLQAIPAPARARARVYRQPDLSFGWRWHCPACEINELGRCPHTVLHFPGTWGAAMCAATRHVHLSHPHPWGPGSHQHHTLAGRTRCDHTPPTPEQAAAARQLLSTLPRPADPSTGTWGFAAEILALEAWMPWRTPPEVPGYAR